MRRMLVALTALSALSFSNPRTEALQAQTSFWCDAYCVTVYGACRAAVLLRPLCGSWFEGCLDGCDVS